MSIPPDVLAERLDLLEWKHRRLQRRSLILLVLVLLLGGWMLYSNVFYDGWHTEADASELHLWSDAHLSFPDKAGKGEARTRYARLTRDAETGHIELMMNDPSVTRVNRLVASDEESMLSLLGPSRIVGLANSGDRALLVLTSDDMQQGLRLGLDAADQPFFDVIRDGEVTSLLETMASGSDVESTAADLHP